MTAEGLADDWLLLVDTCGERGSVALARGERVIHELVLPERGASAALLAGVRAVLAEAKVELHHLAAIGVVSGPGSFTGLRVGLAVSKGLCEAGGLPMAAVSRLEVLAVAGGLHDGLAVLRAGNDAVYMRAVREGEEPAEHLVKMAELPQAMGGGEFVCTEEVLLPLLAATGAVIRYVPITAAQALGPVRRCLAHGGSDPARVDANYVRDEGTIYAGAQRKA